MNYWEDFLKAGDYIKKHQALRASGYFKRNPEDNAVWGDIGRITTLSDLGDQLQQADPSSQISNNAKNKAEEERLISSGEAVLKFNDSEFKVIIPKTKEAAIFFGRNTQWCTSAEKDNRFNDYSEDGDLYIVLHKPTNRRWQLHFESAQFMDERDVHTSFAPFAKLFEKNVFPIDDLSPRKLCGVLENDLPPDIFNKLVARLTANQLAAIVIAISFKTIITTSPARGAQLANTIKTLRPIVRTMMLSLSKTISNGVTTLVFDTPGDMILYAFIHGNDLPNLLNDGFNDLGMSNADRVYEELADLTNSVLFESEEAPDKNHKLYGVLGYKGIVWLGDVRNWKLRGLSDLDSVPQDHVISAVKEYFAALA